MGRFICLGPFGSMWPFLWSSIQVLRLLVGICSFLVLLCREWRWNSWTKTLFSNVLFCRYRFTLCRYLSPVLSGVFPQVVLLVFLVLLFPFCSNIFLRLSFVLSFWPVLVKKNYLRFQSNFPSWFWFFVCTFWGDPNFVETNFAIT